jgi:hypothetical protein
MAVDTRVDTGTVPWREDMLRAGSATVAADSVEVVFTVAAVVGVVTGNLPSTLSAQKRDS